MPPRNTKQSKPGAARKETMTEKLKEIQMRQKKWMQERNQHLEKHSESTSPKTSLNNGSQHFGSEVRSTEVKSETSSSRQADADILVVHHPPHELTDVSDKLNVRVKHGFGSWLQSRSQAKSLDEHNNGKEESLPDHSRVPQNDSSGENYHSTSWGDATSAQTSSRNHLLSPAEFDSLADSIAARVRKDLGIKGTSSTMGARQGSTETAEAFTQQDVGRSRVAVDEQSQDENAAVDVPSHRCPHCSKLMASSKQAPMLQVPCGHSVCKQCTMLMSTCCVCGTPVASHTANLMLQQIIQEFHGKGRQAMAAGSHQKSPLSDHNSSAMSKTSAKSRDVNYSAQLHTLEANQASLQQEVIATRARKASLHAKLMRTEDQVKAIAREQNSLQEQMARLQEKLGSLQQHNEEYSGELQRLKQEHQQAADKLAMDEERLSSLEQDLDKIRFLAEGQADVELKMRRRNERPKPT